MNNQVNQCKGFTLIELLVVVLIIGILAAVALPQYQIAVAKSKFVQMRILGKAIIDAEAVYFLANGTYTNHFEDLDLEIPGKLTENNTIVSFQDYRCYFFFNQNLREIRCEYKNNTKDVPLWFNVLQGNSERCLSYNTQQQKVCKTFSYIKEEQGGSGNYMVYYL